MKLPAPLKWFRWLPKFEPFKRPEFPVDYVLKKRQEAAAKALPVNSIKAVRKAEDRALMARETRRMAR